MTVREYAGQSPLPLKETARVWVKAQECPLQSSMSTRSHPQIPLGFDDYARDGLYRFYCLLQVG
jgi:hypothetical protein